MKISDARNLRIGQIVKTKDGIEMEVFSMNEFIPATGGSAIIYIKCKTKDGYMMKFSHKELVVE